MKWTVARFPNGNWSTGGTPTDYANCEVFVVDAADRKSATQKAQAKRSRQRKLWARKIAVCNNSRSVVDD